MAHTHRFNTEIPNTFRRDEVHLEHSKEWLEHRSQRGALPSVEAAAVNQSVERFIEASGRELAKI